MRLPGAAAVVVVALLLAGCTAGPAQNTSPTRAAPSAADPGECPAGTSLREKLCLADGPVADELSAILHSQFTDAQLNAVIAGVWHDGTPVLTGALGESMTGVPATADMHHLLGNLATPMFTTVVLQRVEAGALALDDPLSTWFPDLPAADQVTVDMLLHHTSGYRHYTEIPSFLDRLWADPFQRWSVQDLVDIGVEGGPAFAPGTDWLFSDTNTLILQLVIEKATGRSAGELLQDDVFDVLGMDDATAAFDANWPSPVLHGYSDERGVWEDVTNWSPTWTYTAGGVGADQDDVRVFLDALGDGSLLSTELHEQQFAPEHRGPRAVDGHEVLGDGLPADQRLGVPEPGPVRVLRRRRHHPGGWLDDGRLHDREPGRRSVGADGDGDLPTVHRRRDA